MAERFSSGEPRLDAVLGGGLPANALNMIIGPPGSGKTILAEQFMFHNASVERPGIYLSTVSEPLDKILRYGEGLDFFDVQTIGTSVFSTTWARRSTTAASTISRSAFGR